MEINLTMLFYFVAKTTPQIDVIHRIRNAARAQIKRTWPKVTHIGLSRALRTLHDTVGMAQGARLPEQADLDHQNGFHLP